jgi:hypothetical protein
MPVERIPMHRLPGDRLLSRRQLLQLGGIGALGLSLPQMLQARTPGSSLAKTQGPDRSCIFIVQYGGASHLDSWDLKPEAPEEIRGPFRPIATNVPGFFICELMPRLARLAERYCIIRSMTHGNNSHDGGMHVCMTGHSEPAPNTPYFGSVAARLRPTKRNIPSYVWLQNIAGDVQPRYLTGGFLGAAYSPLRIGTDLDNPSALGFRVRAFDPSAEVSRQRLIERYALLQRTDAASPFTGGSSASLSMFQERAVDLVAGPNARRAFDLDQEAAQVRDRYGRHPPGQSHHFPMKKPQSS